MIIIDIVTYALLKNKISNIKTGIKNISSEGTKLIFTLADNSKIEVEIPQACVNIYNSLLDFPVKGNDKSLYVAKDNLKLYIWNNNTYTSLIKTNEDFEDEIQEIKEALGLGTDGKVISVQEQISLYAKDAVYKQNDDGSEISIGDALSLLENFNDNLEPFSENDVKNLFLM